MNWTSVVAKINHISVSSIQDILHALDASNHGCNKNDPDNWHWCSHSVSCANHYFIAALMWHSFILETACLGNLNGIWWGDPMQPALCSLASAPDQGSMAVQLHLLEYFVVHYTSSACWRSEWAEKGSACSWHVLHLLKASNIIRAYKESYLPSQGGWHLQK